MALVTAIISWYLGLKSLQELVQILLIAVVVYLAFWIVELIVKTIFVSPVKLDAKLAQSLHDAEEKLEMLHKEKAERPNLTIELENETEGWTGSQTNTCRIVVTNASGSIIDGVCLELTKNCSESAGQ